MNRIDQIPTHEQNGIHYRAGQVFPFGASLVEGGVQFSVFSKEATSCTLVLFHHGQREPFAEIPYPPEFRIGDVYSMIVFGLDIDTTEYGYRFDGPWDPQNGLRFDRGRILLDPYARSVSGRSVWGRQPDPDDPFPHRGQVIREDFDWEGDTHLAMTGEPRGFSRVTAGFSCYDGEFRLPLVLAQASPIFHSSCEGKLGIALE